MVTDEAEALFLRLHYIRKALGFYPNASGDKEEIQAITEALKTVRKERDDLWRKKVVELQKINADKLEVK